MATKTKSSRKTSKQSQDDLKDVSADPRLLTDYEAAKVSLRQFREQWEEFLDLAYARLANAIGFKSRVREGTLSNLLWERSTRVVAQLPTGKCQALNEENDIGKSILMDVAWHKYVIPRANTQYSFLTKTRLWDYYSFIYGAMPAIYDYRVDDEYVGPDWRVLDPRYVFPQAGRLSPNECQSMFVSSYKGREYLKSKLGQKGWNDKAINKILNELNEDYQPDNVWKITNLESDRGQTIDLHKGQAELITKYERGKNGRWVTFCPDFGGLILRDIPNPHKSGRIPIVFKYCMPLLDSIWGMGHVERGASLQKAIDTYVNLAMDFAKFKLFPPMWYTQGFKADSNRYEPGAKWKTPGAPGDAFGFMTVDGQYTEEFTAGYQFLKGALMNQNATNDTTIPANSPDNQQGKTPQALQQQQQSENTGDNFDRNMLEEAFEELANGMINLMATKQPGSFDFHIFDEDIKKIYDSGNKDVLQVFASAKSHYIDPNDPEGELKWRLNGKGAAKVTVSPSNLGDEYMYILDSGTTLKEDDQTEHQNLTEVINFIGTDEGQAFVNAMQQQGKRQLDLAELGQRWIVTGGVKDWEKILPELTPDEVARQQQSQQQQQSPQQFSPDMLQDPKTQAMYAQLAQNSQQTIPKPPSVSLSAKMGPAATAGAEQAANLPTDQPVGATQ